MWHSLIGGIVDDQCEPLADGVVDDRYDLRPEVGANARHTEPEIEGRLNDRLQRIVVTEFVADAPVQVIGEHVEELIDFVQKPTLDYCTVVVVAVRNDVRNAVIHVLLGHDWVRVGEYRSVLGDDVEQVDSVGFNNFGYVNQS